MNAVGGGAGLDLREPRQDYRAGRTEDTGRLLLDLAIACLDSLRAGERRRLAESLDSLEEFSVLSRTDAELAIGRTMPRAAFDPTAAAREAERCLAFLRARGIGFLRHSDPDYPPQLREIADPPFALFVRGRLPDSCLPCVAIVGTRDPDMPACAQARSLARELGLAGVPVVSGLARGIDRSAHEGALEGGGPTVAVLGCGIDEVYPRSNARLASRIVECGGAVVSEYPPGREPLRHRFPERNRIISGLSRSGVGAQAPERSGALITADYALDQGRDLLVLEAGCRGQRGLGSAALAEQGAARLSSAAELVEIWRGNA